jgi:cholestenol delta-isomerase
MTTWLLRRTSSVSCGRNMRYLTRDIWLRTPWFCAWRRWQWYVLWYLLRRRGSPVQDDWPWLQFIWGPLCFFVAYLILNQHSLRHPLQLIVCMSHLYGDTLYYATSLYDHYVHGRPYCRPEAYYFWIYYFLMNFIWIVIPFCKFQNLGVEADTYSYMWQIIFLRVSRRSPMPSKLYSEYLQPKRLGNVRDRHPSRRFSRNHRRTNGPPVGAYDYIWILIWSEYGWI